MWSILKVLFQVWEAWYNTQECPEAKTSSRALACWSRALEPEGPAKSNGVRGRWAFQETQTAHQFHTTSHWGLEQLFWEKCTSNWAGDHRNCQGTKLWQGSCTSLVLQPEADAEEYQQDQCVPSAVVYNTSLERQWDICMDMNCFFVL